uniref:Dehydration-responsive element-binding protein 1B n=1 Tax=Chrysanthemum morifolium TaxID=41568 RepID=B2B9E3_CHRMO|nr:dehydration-responsive element-binding protein 1B [Chrysanthemum x morifolium]
MDMNAPYNSFPSSSLSSSSSTETPLMCSFSSSEPDQVVMLASENPKKRAGRKKFTETRHPVYRGVRSRDKGRKWVCEVRHPITQSRVWLGTHPNAEMAARAHDVAVLAMRGPKYACLNFADSVWRLPVPESNHVADIQKAAAEAAEAFRHTKPEVAMDYYMNEDELPGFLDSMAEALMLPPPQSFVGYGSNIFDDVESCADMSLWNF